VIHCLFGDDRTSLPEREAIGLGWWIVEEIDGINRMTIYDGQAGPFWRCHRHSGLQALSKAYEILASRAP
jgi:hypothetical protein